MLLIAILALRVAKLPWAVILAGVLSPAALLGMELGQISILGGALLVAGLLLSEDRPRLSGGLLGFLVCKPQIGVLVPVVFLAQRNWRGFGFFVLAVGALSASVTLAFGPDVWVAYLTSGHAETARILDAPFDPTSYQGWGVSVFWMFRSLNAGLAVSFAAQMVSDILAVMTIIWLWGRAEVSHGEFAEMVVFLSLLATPYAYTYDMVGFTLALAASVQRRGWRIDMLDAVLWLWPGICLVVTEQIGVLLTPLVICAAWCIVFCAQDWVCHFCL